MKILWGPFNHEAIDSYLLKQLGQSNSKNFGPYGADLIVSNDCQQLDSLHQMDFDCVLLIEPLHRLVAPVIFQLQCPILICCSQPHGLANIIDLIDGIIPLMKTRKEFEKLEKPLAPSLFSISQSESRQSLSVQFPIACLGDGVNSLLFEALESLFPDVHYLQGLPAQEIPKLLRHTQFVLIPDEQPSLKHFEAYHSGAVLVIPDDDALIQALALPSDRLRTYDPLFPKEALSKLLPIQISQNPAAHEQIPLVRIIQELLELTQSSVQARESLTLSQWEEYALNVIVHSTSAQSQQTSQKLSLDQALSLQLDTFSKKRALELWPQLESYFKQRKENYLLNEIQALLDVLPWHVGLRAGLARHVLSCPDLTTAEKMSYIEQTISLLRRSPAWATLKLEILSELLLPLELPEKAQAKPLVMLEGPVYSYTSFARVNLPLLQAWESSEYFDLVLAHSGRRSLMPEFPDLDFKAQPRLPDIVITHHFPHREKMPNWGKRIAIMPWEYGIAPKHTVQIINEEIDETWVPSQFCIDLYLRSGVNPERLCVIPNGVDTQLYCDQGPVMNLPTDKSFKFCYVGGTIPRKGFDILLKTYLKTFTPDDDVCLVIKDYGGKEQYSSDSLHHQILKSAQDPSQPAIVYLFTDFMSEEDLTALYRACDVYVHPYRGEGFGMGILEAMACGLPTIIPDQGPAPEFCPLEASWQVSGLTHFMMPSPTKKEFEIQNFTDLPSFYHEPDEYFLAKAMKEAFADPAVCKLKGLTARKASLAYDWKKIAARAEERIRNLIGPDLPVRLQSPDDKANQIHKVSQEQVSILENKLELKNSVVTDKPFLTNTGNTGTHLIDFDLFHPFVQPQAKGQPYGILSIANWQCAPSSDLNHWQSLLLAYSRLQLGSAQTRLILVANDLTADQVKANIQNFCKSQKIRFGSNLQIEVRDLPQTDHDIQTLYQKATLFVETDPLSTGQWHLIAQAMGIRCISTAQQSWLQHPYCEIAKLDDSLYLAWLLTKLLSNKKTIFNGLAVRTHLRSQYHGKETDSKKLVLA